MKLPLLKSLFYGVLCCLPFLVAAKPNVGAYSQKEPLGFLENRGQIIDQNGLKRKDVDYKLMVGNMSVFLGRGQLHYQWNKIDESDKLTINTYRMDVVLIGANPKALAIAEEKQAYFENYYLPQCPGGVTVQAFKKVTYKNIYPNIDWVIYVPSNGKQGRAEVSGFKYDFIVHLGGDASNIKLAYNGTSAVSLKNEDLIASTPYGTVVENSPVTYDADTKVLIPSKFVLTENILSYKINQSSIEKNNTKTLVIDPAINIDWATYYGGSAAESIVDYGNTCDADISGNPYLCGSTLSTNNIFTSGAYQNSIVGSKDGFLVKFNTAGQRQWATYYGGSGSDDFTGINCYNNTDVFICGSTTSSGLGNSGTQQQNYGGGPTDGIIVKFNSAGLKQWTTYYGGTDSDIVHSIVSDAAGNIYVGGSTKSSTNIATSGAYSNASDGFVAKLNNNGVRSWGKYIGDLGVDFIYTVTLDNSSNVYAAGQTGSTSNIATTGQTVYGGQTDGMLAKYNNSGTLQWATYYGGAAPDYAWTVAADNTGYVYVGGSTDSDNNIATIGGYQTTRYGNDGFFAQFTSAGVRNWGSYLNGGSSGVLSMATDASGVLYFAGQTAMATGIASSGAYKGTPNPVDGYFMSFNAAGSRVYGTYFGGNSSDQVTCVRLTTTGKVLISGLTSSNTGLATSNGHQNTYGGGGDIFLASFQLDTMAYFQLPYVDTLFCAGDSVHIPYGVNSKFNSSNIFTLQMSNASGSFAAPTNIATKASDTAGILNGRIPITTANGFGYRFRIISSSPVRISDRDTLPIHIKPVAAGFSASSNIPICAGDTLRLYGASTTPGLTWNWSGPVSFTSISKDTIIANAQSNRAGDYVLTATLNGCAIRDTETITVKPLPAKPNAGSNTPLCVGSNLNLTATSTTSGVSWSWTGPTSFTSTSQNPTRTGITTADAGNYIVSAILNGCASKDTEAVVINPIPPVPTAGSNSPLCSGNTLTLTASPLSGATYSWTGPGGFGAATQNTSRTNVQVTDAGAYNVTATVNGCTSPAGTVNVTITAGPTVNIYVNPNDTVCAGMPATLVALPLNGGTTPQIKWYRNGNLTSVITTTYVVSAPVNNDVFYCELTNNTTCAVPATANSNSITMTVLPVTPPSVTVSPTFTTPQDPYSLLTFTATGVNGGSNPQYQWTHNHQLVAGATGSTWSTQGLYLSQFDTICVIMTSSEICAVPKKDTACTAVQILLGVEDVNKNNIEVYPNPNDGRFTINATGIRCGKVFIELYNAVGQLVHRQSAEVKQGRIHENVDLGAASAGLYMLRMKGEGVLYQTSVIKR